MSVELTVTYVIDLSIEEVEAIAGRPWTRDRTDSSFWEELEQAAQHQIVTGEGIGNLRDILANTQPTVEAQ